MTSVLERGVAPTAPNDRAATGKAARTKVPRSTAPWFEPSGSRPDPVAVLEQQAATRVPELVPIRYGRMLTSPFAFFRGAALLMASDLATIPHSGLGVQVCGDAHLSNFGVFASPERKLVFDLNDFDETLHGPWEWDVRRLAASVAIAGRDRGFSSKERRTAVLAAGAGYREEMAALAGLGNLDVWYRRVDVEEVLGDFRADAKSVRRQSRAVVQKARTHDNLQAFDRLTTVVDGEPRIVSDPPLLVPLEELTSADEAQRMTDGFARLLAAYGKSLASDRRHLLEQFRLVHIARKVVGVGSVGTRAWVALLMGRDHRDPLFLQAKEAQPSVLASFLGKGRFKNQGERIVQGQRLMQATSDIFLGWEQTEGIDGVRRDFYIRQLRDWKGSFDPEQMVPAGMATYARLCGVTLARAHARSGDRIAIAAYLGTSPTFDRTLSSFAESYADQNQRDFEALQRAVTEGRVVAQSGV